MTFKTFYLYLKLPFLVFFLSTSWLQAQDEKTFYVDGVQAFDEGKDSLGYVYLTEAIRRNPKYYDALYARAYYLMADGEYELASDDYDVLVSLKPDNSELFFYRANAHFYLNAFEKAEDDYLKAYKLDDKDIDIIDGLITLYYTLDLYTDAQFYIKKSLQLNPKNAKAFYYNALVYLGLKKYRPALAEVEKALKLKENNPEFLRLKAKIYAGYNKATNVVETYEQLEDLYPEGLIIEDFLYWSEALYKLKKYKTAEYYLKTPQYHENEDIYYLLARIKYSQYDFQSALAYLDTTLYYSDKYAETSGEIFYNRAYVKYKKRMYQEGEEDYLWSLYLTPELFESKNFAGEKIALFGNCNVVYRAEEKKEAIDSIRVKGFQDRSQVFLNDGEIEEALIEIAKAQEVDSLNINNFILKATCYTFLNKNKEAIQVLDTAKNLAQKDIEKTEVFYTQSLIYADLDNYQNALQSIDQALLINRQRSEFYAQKATMLSELEKNKEAIENINKAIALDGNASIFYTERALYRIKLQDFERGLEDANKALEIDETDILAYYARGLAQMKLKKYEEAMIDFEQILDIFPEDIEVQSLYQRCQENLEKK